MLKRFKNGFRLLHFSKRRLSDTPENSLGNFSSTLINDLIESNKECFKSYLEIGTQFGLTLEAIKIDKKTGVDPNPRHSLKKIPKNISIYKGTSNDFFITLSKNKLYDLIFIDGLHTFQQVYRDFINAVNHLSLNGLIVIDDVIPVDAYSASCDQEWAITQRNQTNNNSKAWQGDVFKMIQMINVEMPDFELDTVIYPDNPKSIIRFRNQKVLLEFDDELYEKYNKLDFMDVFSDYYKVSKDFKFEFGWNLKTKNRLKLNNQHNVSLNDIQAH